MKPANITSDDIVIRGTGTIKAKVGNYGAGVLNGAVKVYILFYCTGERPTVSGITIDGNDQFSQYYTSPSLPNYWLTGVYFQGTSYAVLQSSPHALNVKYINGGGWPIKGTYCRKGLIDGCSVEDSMGVGFDGSTLCVVSNNSSYGAYDGHFATWNSIGGVVANNTCDTSTNGSGVDASGSTDFVVSGNTIRNCANRGIWVLQDPNINKASSNGVIIGNNLFNNNTYTLLSERGDIHVGAVDVTTDSRPVGTIDVSGLTIVGNTIHSFSNANSITLGKYAFDVLIEGNTFSDSAASPATRSVMLYQSGTTIMRNNNDLIFSRGGTPPKVLGTGPAYFDNVFSSIDTSAAGANVLGTTVKTYRKETNRSSVSGVTYQIQEHFGYTTYAADFTSINGSKDIIDINFPSGGFEVSDIEVIALVPVDHGILQKHVTYHGYSAVIPTAIVLESTIYSGGSVPPTITFTASTAKVRIAVGTNGVFSCAVYIKIIGTSGVLPFITSLI